MVAGRGSAWAAERMPSPCSSPQLRKTKEKPPSLSSGVWCGRWDFPAGWPTVHWTVGPCAAVPSPCSSPQLRIPNKNPHGGVRHGDLCLVRKMGLEPTRHRHTHLKRACLPIPALPQIAFDCKKDSSTFGGIKSSPILYLFSCPIKRPLQQFLSFITVILTRKPFVGAVFAPTHGDGRCLLGNRRGAFYMLPWQWAGDAAIHGATPPNYGGYQRLPCAKGDSPQCGEMSRSDRGARARRAVSEAD